MKTLSTPLATTPGAPGRRPTMKDVAALVGVHQTTVSLALRDHPGIPVATREKIREAAARIGYRPDPALDAFNFYRLSNHPIRSAPLMAFLSDQPSSSACSGSVVHRDLYEGARAQAEKLGFVLERFLVGPGQLSAARLDHVLVARNIGCVLLGAFSLETAELPLDWSRLCALKIDSFHVQPRLDVVSANYQDAARQAVLRLRAQGRRRIGLVIARGDETRLENHAYAGFLVEHATTDWERTIPPFAIDDASAGPVRDWAEWLSRHRIDALVVAAPGWDGWLEHAGIQAPGIPVVRFRVRAERGQPGLVLNHREVGGRAVELLAMRWHTNQRGLPAFVSNTFTPVDWSDGSEPGVPAAGEAGARASAPAGGR